MAKLDRITTDPKVMGGEPCIRGLRVTVKTVLGLLVSGRSVEEVLEAYPYLEPEDIVQAVDWLECQVAEDAYIYGGAGYVNCTPDEPDTIGLKS